MSKEESSKPWQDTIKWEYESARQREKIYKQTLERFANDASIKAYINQFQQTLNSVELYAWLKAKWLVDKAQVEWCIDYNSSEDLITAQTCLGNIQQKKLFDKQCLWRAEQFTHPAIETTADFTYWEHNILNCPFIDPITKEDVELYIQFLQEYLGEDLVFLGGWQDYNSYNSSFATVAKMMHKPKEGKSEDDEEDDDDDSDLMPPWYIFVNEHRRDGHYLLLPDIRQEKEWKYSRIGQAEVLKIHKENLPPPDTRPFLNITGNENMENFINIVEDDPEEVLKAYRVYQQFYYNPQEENTMYWVKEAFDALKDCYESFPIATNIKDWKEALIATAKQWTNTKIARNLPYFYEDYLLRNATGIQNVTDEEQVAIYRKMADDYKERILLGRELSGEPRDLDF